MVLYFIYKNSYKKKIHLEQKLPTTISTMDTYPVCDAPKHDTKKDTNTHDQIITSENTREENVEAGSEESKMVSPIQPINDTIKDVTQEDMVIKVSTGCTSMVQPIGGIEDHHNQMRTREATNQVYLVESAA